MKKRPSYSELMKQEAMKKNDTEQENVYVQMILDEIVFTAKAKRLGFQIDEALDQKDDQLFYKLSNEYKQLMKHA